MSDGNVQIKLLGTSLTIKTDENPSYMAEIVRYLEKKILDAEKFIRDKDSLKISILAGILLTDELFKTRNRSSSTGVLTNEEGAEAEILAKKMIEKIEDSLKKID